MAVYFVQAGIDGPVKIGFAANVAARVKAIQSCCPIDLILLRETKGTRFVETWFHREFAPFRVRHEWFTFDPRMLSLEAPRWLIDGDPRNVYIRTHKRVLAEDIARELGVNPETIRKWRQRGGVPHRWRLPIIQFTAKRGQTVPAVSLGRP